LSIVESLFTLLSFFASRVLPMTRLDDVAVADKVREANGCVLVHCLAGISRSPTLAIAYVMRALNMTTDEAYR
jgi:dual specificity MAP kinase phosphatase